MKKKTTEEYKSELKEKNPNIECLEEYITNATKILHRCKKCGYEWKTIPIHILKGSGCPKCKGGIRKTTEEYKAELKKINIICLEEYVNNSTKILHRCLVCGNIWKIAPLELKKCPTCSLQEKTYKKKTTEEYKEQLKSINPNIEPLEEYINNKTKILHRCLKCGNIWKIDPIHTLRGNSCPACARTKKKTTEEYKKEIENSNIICLEEYVNNSTKILHKCKKCGYEWKITPHNILRGYGCPVCSGLKKKTTEEYKSELKGRNIECLEEYANNKTKILHKCLVCGYEWKAIPNDILSGVGCPCCRSSHGERKVENFLVENKISFIPQKRFSDCKDKQPLPFDFYLPEKNIAIEYNGRQHYASIDFFGGEKQLHLQRHHDWLKRKYCKKNNITLITIRYDESVEEKLGILNE